MRLIYPILAVLPLFAISSCTQEEAKEPVVAKFEPVSALVNGNNKFAISFYKNQTENQGNLFVSPISISSAFGMVAMGSDGNTADEMFAVLHQTPDTLEVTSDLMALLKTPSSPTENDTLLSLANAVWIQNNFPILPTFKSTIKKGFKAPFEEVDFINKAPIAVKRINNWVDEKTNGNINQLISENDVGQDTRMVLTSAVYMSAKWVFPFEKNATKDEQFFVSENETVMVPTMENIESFYFYEDDSVSVLEMPYLHESEQGARLSFYMVVPKSKFGLSNIENNLSLETMEKWERDGQYHRVWLSMPKFKIETNLDLNDSMAELGMKDAFTTHANFSKITGHKDLYISKAVHKTFIDLDEKGTEAAAATGIMMNLTSLLEPVDPYRLVVDHPSFFYIKDRDSGVILFMGRIQKP